MKTLWVCGCEITHHLGAEIKEYTCRYCGDVYKAIHADDASAAAAPPVAVVKPAPAVAAPAVAVAPPVVSAPPVASVATVEEKN